MHADILSDVRILRTVRAWDRRAAQFVDIVAEKHPDINMPCSCCRFYRPATEVCHGVGSSYYMKQIPFAEFVPKQSECEIRLPPDLTSFLEN